MDSKITKAIGIWTIVLLLISSFSAGLVSAKASTAGAKHIRSAPKVLPADIAFSLSAQVIASRNLQLIWQLDPSVFLYRNKIKIIDAKTKSSILARKQLPNGVVHEDFDGRKIQIYKNKLHLIMPWPTKAHPNGILLTYQGCSEHGVCYGPQYKQLTYDPKSEQIQIQDYKGSKDVFKKQYRSSKTDQIVGYITQYSAPLMVLIFFMLGVLLSFTPCMLPLLPITVNIIVGSDNKNSTSKAVMLVSTYVLSMAVCYTGAGLVAASLGSTIQVWFQNTWVIVGLCLLLSFFAVMQLELIASNVIDKIAQKLHFNRNMQKSGTFVGVIIMGIASALALSPCATPALIGILTYISQTGKPWLGAIALFSMSLGMGAPLVVIALFGKQVLPRAGMWLHTVKHLTGFALFGLVIWLLARIIPQLASLLLWFILLLAAAWYLGMFRLPEVHSKWQKFERVMGLGFLFGAVGVAILLGGILEKRSVAKKSLAVTQGVTAATAIANDAAAFKQISDISQLDQALSAAISQHKPVLLFFHANWCTYCKELDQTFEKLAGTIALTNFVLLQVDLTNNTAANESLIQKYKIFGLPAVLFFDAIGIERAEFRLSEPLEPEKLQLHLEQVLE